MVRRVRGGILRNTGLSVAVCSREGVEDGHHLGFHNGCDGSDCLDHNAGLN